MSLPTAAALQKLHLCPRCRGLGASVASSGQGLLPWNDVTDRFLHYKSKIFNTNWRWQEINHWEPVPPAGYFCAAGEHEQHKPIWPLWVLCKLFSPLCWSCPGDFRLLCLKVYLFWFTGGTLETLHYPYLWLFSRSSKRGMLWWILFISTGSLGDALF